MTNGAESTLRFGTHHVLAIAGTWFAVSLLFLPQMLVINGSRPAPDPFLSVVYSNLILFLLWAALTPSVLRLADRFPIERGHRAGRIALHLVFALVASIVHLSGMILLLLPLGTADSGLAELALGLLVGTGATNVLMYGAVVSVGHALAYLSRFRAVERTRAQAHLASLRAQLRPHFLFNTLNALSELVHRDPSLAEHLILRLSDLLRRSFADSAEEEVTIAEELDFTRAYLDIQQALMGGRLTIRIAAHDTLRSARVPSMLLQPLTENAIRHGLSTVRRGGTLHIEVYEDSAMLVIAVSDDGRGPIAPTAEGIGVRNTRSRLAALYGTAGTLVTETLRPGFRATVRLPLHTSTS